MTDKTREDFEAWLVKRWVGDRDGLTRRADGEYLLGPVQLAWAATQQSAARIAALEAEVLALRKDAERYAWLRSKVGATTEHERAYVWMPCGNSKLNPAETDAAIDAAIEAERGEG